MTWSAGQLEKELRMQDWAVVDPSEERSLLCMRPDDIGREAASHSRVLPLDETCLEAMWR